MAAGEFRYRNVNYRPHTFEWKIEWLYILGEFKFYLKTSPFFHFCGYYCQLYCNPKKTSNGCYLDIGLKGYPAPFRRNVSCYCSFSLINSNGEEQFTKEGRIYSADKTIHAVISENIRWRDLTERKGGFTFCFSWCEDDVIDVSNRGMLPINRIERETQTEDVQILQTGDTRYDATCSTNIEIATQTESNNPDICCCNDKESNRFLQILSKDFVCFYDDKTDSDCVLKVGKMAFPVHRSVLSARSSVFAAMFHHDTSESRSGEVNIQDVDACVLEDVLYYIYGGKIRGLSPDTAVPMYVLSDKYGLLDLREKCLDFLKKNLTMENVCDAALLAHTDAEIEMEDKVLQFIEKNLEDLMHNDNWRKFTDTHYKLANNLLCSAFMASKKKNKAATY